MMRILCLLLIIIPFFITIGCDNSNGFKPATVKKAVEVEVIYFNYTKTHELIVYGHKMDETIFPEKICVKKVTGNWEVEYKSYDPVSLESSGFDLTYAWSPNGDYLILPRGRFEGFTVFSTEILPNAVAKGNGQSFIAIKGIAGSKWWHEFVGWKNHNTIIFQAGLSSKSFTFEWNIEDGDLLSLDLEKGEYDIEEGPRGLPSVSAGGAGGPGR